MNLTETPIERMKRTGALGLTISELLAVILQRQDDAKRIAEDLGAIDLQSLRSLDMHDTRIASWPETEKAAIVAAVTFVHKVRRLVISDREDTPTPALLASYLATRYQGHQIRAGAVFLDAQSRVITDRIVAIGTAERATLTPANFLREALRVGAHSFVCFATRPSGHVEPSTEDLTFCKRLAIAGTNMGIDLVDFMILGDASTWSSFNSAATGVSRATVLREVDTSLFVIHLPRRLTGRFFALH